MSRAWILASLITTFALCGCGPDTTWKTAFDAQETGWLMNVWSLRDDYRIAVGGSFSDGRAMHYDGETWVEQETGAEALINWAHGLDENEVWAVGSSGTILRWDGSAWASQESPTDQDLWGVWGAAADDVWAVGGSARFPSMAEPTVIHYDGSSWSVVELPALERTGVAAYFKVWGSSANDVYVVGDAGVVLHWDGTTWTELFVGATDDLVALWGTGPDNIVAVGGRGNGIVSHWDGSEWRSVNLSPLRGLNGVWMRDPGVAHLVGLGGTSVTLDVATLTPTELIVAERLDFHAVSGVDGRLVAVGGNLAVPSDPEGIAWTRELGDDE
ncbi:MAG: WD40/YVTN/BNR-like repeat-containing protein [Sandaracinaceae bacterium]